MVIREGFLLGVWMLVWSAAGWTLSAGAFRLRRGETDLVGFAVGLVLQVWLANLLGRFLGAYLAFWMSPVILLILGVAAGYRQLTGRRLAIRWKSWLMLGLLTMLFFAIGRGLAIFDDYQNLPTVSLMAAGDVPPHFALDPALRFGYHYFLLLFAAQLMRIGSLLPWTALDLARAFMLALPLMLAGMWVFRLTRDRVAALVGASLVALAGGARWLLLLLPPRWLESLSSQVTLIGSAAATAPTLAEAMISSWKIDGDAPIAFPFAFYSGVNQPYVMLHTGIAGSGIAILMLLLLTASRWRNWRAAAISAVLLATLAIANEIAFLLLGLGFLLVVLAVLVRKRSTPSRRGLRSWLLVGLGATLVATLQGGMLTEIISGIIRANTAAASYFDASPDFVWPPAIVSAHMGALLLTNPGQVMLILLETGPMVLVTPLLLARGWRALRRGRWMEAVFIAGSAGVIVASLVVFRGPLFSAGPRLMSTWFIACALYFVPLLWWRRSRSIPSWRISGIAVAFVSCFGGLVLLAIQLTAIQRPVYATFISPLDAKMSSELWDKLDRDALVLDPVVFRAPTVFGRPTRSSPTWYTRYETWDALVEVVDPRAIRAAGFTYVYLDSTFWDSLTSGQQASLGDPCIEALTKLEGQRSETDFRKDFRWLLDVRACE